MISTQLLSSSSSRGHADVLNVLYLYNSSQTYTNTVYEHIASFGKYSRHRSFYCHQDTDTDFEVDLSRFDAVGIHFSIRLPYDQFSPSTVRALQNFRGLKFLFIQDEYDHTKRAWYWINMLGIQLVFTVVPDRGIERIYPPCEFRGTRFINTLTGYVPDELRLSDGVPAPSSRGLIFGYRGRPLPIRYGRLGIEKVEVGVIVKSFCDKLGISNDIAWTEESRIYGSGWYEFMISCRAMLGSESGSNVFDWDGTLVKRVAEFRREHPDAPDSRVYATFIEPEEIDGIMNQISPRVFEAIAARTVLVLFEGRYSDIVVPWVHFIPLKKDGSNLPEVIEALKDGNYVDSMADRAYRDVIESGKYSYASFVGRVDDEVSKSIRAVDLASPVFPDAGWRVTGLGTVTTSPIRAAPPRPSPDTIIHAVAGSTGPSDLLKRFSVYTWWKLPESARGVLRPAVKWLRGRK